MRAQDDELIPLHFRDYAVRSYRKPDGSMLIRGTVVDRKDAGIVIRDDPDELTIHHMQIDLTVSCPDLVITAVDVMMPVHPHDMCPTITAHYSSLVGTSVSRGFTHRVRELFGGPKGCSHVTALLQAMGPIAYQSLSSMHFVHRDVSDAAADGSRVEMLSQARLGLRNTCHVWADGGELAAFVETGTDPPTPIPITERLKELGRDPEEWNRELSW